MVVTLNEIMFLDKIYMALAIILKVVGAGLSGLGSILIAWRGYQLFKLYLTTIKAHEVSIFVLAELLNNKESSGPVIINTHEHIDEFNKKSGLFYLALGFIALVLGSLANAISYFI